MARGQPLLSHVHRNQQTLKARGTKVASQNGISETVVVRAVSTNKISRDGRYSQPPLEKQFQDVAVIYIFLYKSFVQVFKIQISYNNYILYILAYTNSKNVPLLYIYMHIAINIYEHIHIYIHSNKNLTSHQYLLIMLHQIYIFNDLSLNHANLEASCNQPCVLPLIVSFNFG